MITTESLADEIEWLNQLSDDERQQAKLDRLIAIMDGETANFSAGVYVSLLAGFAIAVGNTGIDPMSCITRLSSHTREEIRRLLKDQGISIGRA